MRSAKVVEQLEELAARHRPARAVGVDEAQQHFARDAVLLARPDLREHLVRVRREHTVDAAQPLEHRAPQQAQLSIALIPQSARRELEQRKRRALLGEHRHDLLGEARLELEAQGPRRPRERLAHVDFARRTEEDEVRGHLFAQRTLFGEPRQVVFAHRQHHAYGGLRVVRGRQQRRRERIAHA